MSIKPVEVQNQQNQNILNINEDGSINTNVVDSVNGNVLLIQSDGSIDVNVQDQTTPTVDVYFTRIFQDVGVRLIAQNVPAIDPDVPTYDIVLNDVTNILVGDFIGVFGGGDRFYFGTAQVVDVGTNTITLDSPLDYAFQIGDAVTANDKQLDVNGSKADPFFYVVGVGTGSEISVDITRIILEITTDTVPEWTDFGDIAGGLINGLVFRKIAADDTITNIFNWKTNADIAQVCYDLTVYEQARSFNVNGISARITFGGQSKHGVVLRLDPGDRIQFIIQDDLSDLLSFAVMAQGHRVTGSF